MNNTMTRRTFLHCSAVGAALASAPALSAPSAEAPAGDRAADESYWQGIAANYRVSPDFLNLENAYYGIMAKPVLEDFKRNIDFLNLENSRYMRQEFDRDGIEAIRAQLARHMGVAVEEIALTRGATESLQNLIANYQRLKKGDTVMYGNLDYDAMIYAMDALAARHDAKATMVQLPDAPTRQNVLDTYEQALRKHPRTRLLLLTHISHRTGLVLPVAELVQMAKRRGVDVIVDVAQSWGQLDYTLPDLQADFVGGNLHKWIGAPLGLGFIYVRKQRLADIGVQLGDRDYGADDIRARVHAGTLNSAAVMTIPAALAFHERIGTAHKGARLRYQRDHWVRQLRDHDAVQILTPDEPGLYGAVTSFRLRGKTSMEDNVALARRLMEQYRIFTVPRGGPAGGSCIRVTPSLFTGPADLDRLVAAIREIAAG